MRKSIDKSDFIEGARAAVLIALDGYMRDLTGSYNARGAADADLPALFKALDAHMERVATRLNDPESQEIGAAFLSIA